MTPRPVVLLRSIAPTAVRADATKGVRASGRPNVRLIRSKGVGVVFVTQTPKRISLRRARSGWFGVQHGLRASTPDDLGEAKATVQTFLKTSLELDVRS